MRIVSKYNSSSNENANKQIDKKYNPEKGNQEESEFDLDKFLIGNNKILPQNTDLSDSQSEDFED